MLYRAVVIGSMVLTLEAEGFHRNFFDRLREG